MDSTFSLLSALKSQQRQMDAVSNNLANINTPGFKKDQVLFKEYFNEIVGQDLESEEERFSHDDFVSPYSRSGSSFVVTDHIASSIHQGKLKNTNNPYDLALQTPPGKQPGFFVVDTVYGPRYTRNGHFMLDSEGFLITNAGDRVLGEKGPVKIDGKEFSVGSDGQIIVDRKEVDVFQVFEFERPEHLTKLGNSYWVPSSKNQVPIKADNVVMHQGVIEGSNVETVDEMVKMIAVNRSYEASQKAMRSNDELDEGSISIARI